MKDKGFAITTVIYSIVLLITLVAVMILGLLKAEYSDQKDYIRDINEELTECLQNKTC